MITGVMIATESELPAGPGDGPARDVAQSLQTADLLVNPYAAHHHFDSQFSPWAGRQQTPSLRLSPTELTHFGD
jgi:hypothetical protein